MAKRRSRPVCSALWRSLCQTICITILMATVGLAFGSQSTLAQLGGPLLTVYADPEMVLPGERVSFTVIASGAGPYSAINVDVPSALTVSESVSCVHSTYYCDGSSVTRLTPEMNRLSVSAPGNDVPVPQNWPTDGYSERVSVTITFSVYVPLDSPPGTRFQINSYVEGLFNPLFPYDEAGRHVRSVIEVLSTSGQRVTLPPTPAPTTVPASTTAEIAHAIRFEINQGHVLPSNYMVPGDSDTFHIFQGFSSVEGSFALTLTVPSELNIIVEPSCFVIVAETCGHLEATRNADGSTEIEVLGYSSITDPVRLDFATEVSSSVPIGASTEITGQYSVADALTGEQHETDLWTGIYFADSDTAFAASVQEGVLRVRFEYSGQLIDALGGCVALSQDGRWTSQYFVCDNDSGASEPPFNGLRVPSDNSPTVGIIEVFMEPGTYYVSLVSPPVGFNSETTSQPDTTTVSPDGAELTLELSLPK